jgi:tRNA pseudouridine55 synthase
MIKEPLDFEIIPVWQPQGYSTYQITKDIAAKLGKKTTHTGVLDPMAEGVIIVLAGDRRFEKSTFSDGTKKYEFDLTFGISTDSYDGMGLVTQIDLSNQPSQKAINDNLSSFIGEYSQTVPLYSAQKVEGKKLFMYPRLGLPAPKLPKKQGTIYDIKLLEYREVSLDILIEDIITKIKNIRLGEFRKEEIYKGWNELLNNSDLRNNIFQATVSVETSRGLYIRSLSQDICYKLGVFGFVTKLIRTQNGVYTKNDCCTVDEVC